MLSPVFATAKPFRQWDESVRRRTCGGSILFGDEDAKRSLMDTELHRAITDQFPVDFDRDGLIAFHPQSAGLEIFNLRHPNVGAKHNVLEIFDNLEIAETLEDDNVQQTVVDHRVFKKREGAAVEPSVADKNE